MKQWNIGLEGWIIPDGNYDDFHRGQDRPFAVEIFVRALEPSARPGKQVEHLEGIRYRVNAELVYLSDQAVVLDFGLQAYWRRHGELDRRLPAGATVGSFVCGEIGLGIDPFDYFERLNVLPGIPPLIYTWYIDEITRNRGVYVEGTDASGRPCWVPDESNVTRAPVESTDAPTPVRWITDEWQDTRLGPTGSMPPSYWQTCTLRCTRLDAEPTHHSNDA